MGYLAALVSATSLLGLLATASAHAQTYPSRPITLVVTAAAGGVTDVVARAFGQKLSEDWGQQVIVENKGGAAHVIGASWSRRLRRTATPCWWPKPAPSDQSGDLSQGQAALRREDDLVAGHRPRPHQSGAARQQVAAGQQRQGADRACQAKARRIHLRHRRHRFGTAHEHRAVQELSGVKLNAVHYRGAAPALNDLIAGHISLMSVSVSLACRRPRGKDQDPRHRQQEAAGAGRRHPDRRGDRPAGLRGHHLVRPVRAGRHAARRRDEDQRRGAEDLRRSCI